MFRIAIVALAFTLGFLQAQDMAKISGKVTDALTHQPIPNVSVAGSIGPVYRSSRTAADGSYTLDNLSAGTINLTVNLDGYALISWNTDKSAQIKVASGEAMTRDFVLHPLARIYGKLVDRDTGDPIEGHTVSAMRKEYQPGHMFFAGTFGVVKNGDFDIRNLEPGDYLIQVDAPDEATIAVTPEAASKNAAATDPSPKKYYGPRWYPDVARSDMAAVIHLSEGENTGIRIVLQSRETHSIAGTVVVSGDASREFEHQPVSLVFRPSDGGAGMPRPASQMPAPGPFHVDNIAAGTYRLAFTAGKPPNQLAGDYQIEITDHDIEGFKAELAPEAGVSGEFRMLEKDAPLPDKLRVFMVPVSAWLVILEHGMLIGGNMPVSGSAAEQGRFHQESLRPGEYWPVLAGLPKGYAVAQVLFQGSSPRNSVVNLVGPGQPLSFVLTSRLGAVAVVVRDENQIPVRGASIMLLPDPLPERVGPGVIRTGASGDDGGYVFTDVAPGNYRTLILPAQGSANWSDIGYLRQLAMRGDPFEVRAGQAVSVNLKP